LSQLWNLSQKVVAFKSIAAYRSGLRIDPMVSAQEAENALQENLRMGSPVRVSSKALIDFIFTRALEVATQRDVPLQIHTGFGDKDLQLELANPLHLRAVLETPTFARCRVVLLHGSYPFMREASYLASVYPQVHLDFGLVIPKLSVRGMRCAVSDLLDLAPINKIMFSTDGYAFPETFFLGAKWSREILSRVLIEAYDNGDLPINEALAAADGILGRHALDFYKLEGRGGFSASTDNLQRLQSFSGTNLVSLDRSQSFTPRLPPSIQDSPKANKETNGFNAVFQKETMRVEGEQKGTSAETMVVKHVRLLYADGSGQRRCRVIPIGRYAEVSMDYGVGLTQACMGMTSFSDAPAPNSGVTNVGEIRLMPDASTKHRLPWCPEHELVLADMHVKPGIPWQLCPRSVLRRVALNLVKEFGLVVRAGFESEFYLLKRSTGPKRWEGMDVTPYCSSAGFDAASPVLSEIHSTLASLDVNVEQMHCESGGGQFEMVVSHSPCLRAADNLLLLREAVTAVANKYSLHATFLPKYSKADAGSGAHVHLSIWQGNRNVFMGSGPGSKHGMSKAGQEFMAGVLLHLPSILAFTAPNPNSYARILPNTWSGAYQCWGRDNREAPIRTASPPGVDANMVSNFEIKAFDGCANPHLGLAAIIASGIDGLRKHLQLPEPVEVNPDELEPGKVNRLPRALEQAVEALEADRALRDLLGPQLLTAICAIRKAEVQYYKGKEDLEELLVDRY
jgi:glutamine synthetase/predicted TIM-barrel fold metal-dependent hydrolase